MIKRSQKGHNSVKHLSIKKGPKGHNSTEEFLIIKRSYRSQFHRTLQCYGKIEIMKNI